MPKIRKQWEIQEGRDWPTVPETGANYHGHHKKPVSEGGGWELENIEPMHPVEHKELHMKNRDFAKWGGWARGRKPTLPEVPGLGVFQVLPEILGVLSGRIRTDSLDNTFSDIMGVPSQEDIRKFHEEMRKKYAPNLPPGSVFVEV